MPRPCPAPRVLEGRQNQAVRTLGARPKAKPKLSRTLDKYTFFKLESRR